EGRLPDAVVACVGGGSNAIGLFAGFLADDEVRLVGVEAAGAASLGSGRAGVLHGARSSLLADEDGQIADAHSISAGLDYPGVGPEHALLRDTGRAEYLAATDEEALAAFHLLAEREGIIPALEPALAQGMRTKACLECLAEIRAQVDVPLIPMTYASILEAYGYERFQADAEKAGATSLIVADLPLEAAPEIRRVQLVAPTTPPERIRLAAERTDGWLYLVSLTGTTGARTEVSAQLAGLVGRARAVTAVPLLAGFGIATPEQAADAAALADGIVVGS